MRSGPGSNQPQMATISLSDTLVLFGIATSGVVLSTVLWAADADYRLFVIKDCCADLDETVHRMLDREGISAPSDSANFGRVAQSAKRVGASVGSYCGNSAPGAQHPLP